MPDYFRSVLSDYAWNNVVNMEPRAKLCLDRLIAYVTPYMPANTKPCPNLQFTLEDRSCPALRLRRLSRPRRCRPAQGMRRAQAPEPCA
ncbi:MAG: hypothetical protein IKP26_01910 [Clostridia bacterium]|nr:hypothetical protein [Clostridia bacterium]